MSSSSGSAMEKRLFELRMKINAGRKANKKEVVEEHKRKTDPKALKKEKASEEDAGASPKKRKRQAEEGKNGDHVEAKLPSYLTTTAEDAGDMRKKDKKKKKKEASFGWDVFNQDSLYNAYKKRLQKLPSIEDKQASGSTTDLFEASLDYGQNDKVSKEGMNRLVEELEERAKVRKNFSRRRQHYNEHDVDYINDRNQHFNKKISRAFDKYTVEIRQNIERGTAI